MSGYSANFTKNVRITGEGGTVAGIDICGNTNLGGQLVVAGNTDLAGDLDVTGDTTVSNVNASGTLDVTGDTTVSNISATGTLDVTGDTTLQNVNIEGNSNFSIGTSSDSNGYFVTILDNGNIQKSQVSLPVLKSSATSGSSGDEVTTIIENIQIVAPDGSLLDNSMSTFVDINSGGTTVGGGLSVGGEFNGRRYFNFVDGSSNTDSTEYITDHYMSSDSNLNMVFGAKKNLGSPHLSNPKFTINSIATDGLYNEVFHLTDSDISINLQPGSGSRVSVFEATGTMVKLGVDTEINGDLYASGNVGIGTSSLSSYKLNVNGTANVSSNLTVGGYLNGPVTIYEPVGTHPNANNSGVYGTLVLKHGDAYGHSSITFASKNNATSDCGFIEYRDDYNDTDGSTSERSVLIVGVKNDTTVSNVRDCVAIMSGDAGGGYTGINTLIPEYTLDVNGTANVSSNLTVGGTSDLNGNLDVSGTANVSSNLTVGGTLGVTGNTTIDGTLGITNDLTVSSNTIIDTQTSMDGTSTSEVVGQLHLKPSGSGSGNSMLTLGGRGENTTVSSALYYKRGSGNYGRYNGRFGIAVTNSASSTGDGVGIGQDELDDLTHLTINYNGNVGIGTTSPSYKLDVSGTANVSDKITSSKLYSKGAHLYAGSLHDGGGVFSSKMPLILQAFRGGGTDSTSNDTGHGVILGFAHENGNVDNLTMGSRSCTIQTVSEAMRSVNIGMKFTVCDNQTEKQALYINHSGAATFASNLTVGGTSDLNGNLDVSGTANVSSNLTVGGTATINGDFEIAAPTSGQNDLTIRNGDLYIYNDSGIGGTGKPSIFFSEDRGSNHNMTIQYDGDGYTSNSNRLSIISNNSGVLAVFQESGNVGIGTTSPQGRLHVKVSGEYDSIIVMQGVNVSGNRKFEWHIRQEGDDNLGFYNYNDNNDFRSQAIFEGDFTGSHRALYERNDADIEKMQGLIVVSNGNYSNTSNFMSDVTIDETIPIVSLSKKMKDKRVFGVISRIEDVSNTKKRKYGFQLMCIYNVDVITDRLYINSLGEGGIWVSNINGKIENGDYITSSTIPGYGMKQNEEYLSNFTVAKITCDCTFSLVQGTIDKVKMHDVEGTTDGPNDTIVSKTFKLVSYDPSTNEVLYEPMTDASGNVIYDYKYKTRFLLPDGSQITREEYDDKISNNEEVYIACFVGCTYHCG
jgi:hypothetical protein